jgi:hypothetical protein
MQTAYRKRDSGTDGNPGRCTRSVLKRWLSHTQRIHPSGLRRRGPIPTPGAIEQERWRKR